MKRCGYMMVVVAGLLLPGGSAAAQQAAERVPHAAGRLVLGGALAGGAGLLVGGFTGAWIGSNYCHDEGNPDSCRPLEGLAIGAAAGQALSIPVGVHIANQGRGRLGPSLLASAAIGAAGVLAVTQANSDEMLVGVIVGVPVLQLASSVVLERATTRRRR